MPQVNAVTLENFCELPPECHLALAWELRSMKRGLRHFYCQQAHLLSMEYSRITMLCLLYDLPLASALLKTPEKFFGNPRTSDLVRLVYSGSLLCQSLAHLLVKSLAHLTRLRAMSSEVQRSCNVEHPSSHRISPPSSAASFGCKLAKPNELMFAPASAPDVVAKAQASLTKVRLEPLELSHLDC